MGLPSKSSRRRVIWAGVDWTERLWAVPETAWRVAYSGRAPKAVKTTHWLVPLRQAFMVAVWPSASGPTVSALVAMPLELVRAAALPAGRMPDKAVVCHKTFCALSGMPLERTSA